MVPLITEISEFLTENGWKNIPLRTQLKPATAYTGRGWKAYFWKNTTWFLTQVDKDEIAKLTFPATTSLCPQYEIFVFDFPTDVEPQFHEKFNWTTWYH